MLYCDARVAQQRTVNAASLFVDNNCGWLAPGLDTAIHADSPFNQLKAALNSESHAVKECDNATVALTSAGLSGLIASFPALSSFIRDAFTLQDGTRISRANAMCMAANVRGLFLQRGTCAVALPAVAGCTTVHSWHFHIVLVFGRSTRYLAVVLVVVGILHAHGCVWTPCDDCCVMALGQLWTLHAPCPLVAVHRRAHPGYRRRCIFTTLALSCHRCGVPCVLAATRLLIAL